MKPKKDIKTQNIRSLIKTAMADRKWTVYKLAQESGVPVSRLYKWFDKKKAGHIESVGSQSIEKLLASLDLVIVKRSQVPQESPAELKTIQS